MGLFTYKFVKNRQGHVSPVPPDSWVYGYKAEEGMPIDDFTGSMSIRRMRLKLSKNSETFKKQAGWASNVDLETLERKEK